MGVQNERKEIARYYGTSSQFAKRLEKMSDSQILAIYYRLKREGRIR